MLSVIIVSYNTKDILQKCLTKVYNQQKFTDYEVIVVDNNSHDGSREMISNEFPQVNLIHNTKNSGFAGGNNIGIKAAKGDFILLLNSDAYIFEDTLLESMEHMVQNPFTGIMGVQLTSENGELQPSAHSFPTPTKKLRIMTGYESKHPQENVFYDFYHSEMSEQPSPRKVDWVPGTYFLIRKQVVDDIGFLDENFFMYYEEVDYCKRAARAGWDVIFNPNIITIHLGGASSKKTKKQISRKGRQLVDIRVNSEYYYYRKNHGLFVMLLAAFYEIGWKSMIYLKNMLLKDENSIIKRSEAKLAVNLVFHRIIKAF